MIVFRVTKITSVLKFVVLLSTKKHPFSTLFFPYPK